MGEFLNTQHDVSECRNSNHPIAVGCIRMDQGKQRGHQIGGQLWSTYWSADGQHESGSNFYTEEEREQDALRVLRHGWKVAFGDHAGLQEKLVQKVKEYDEVQNARRDRVDG